MDKKKIGMAIGCAVVVAVLAICAAAFGGKKADAPEPAATAEATATPEVTAAPAPTATPEPTAAPEEAVAEEADADVVTPESKSVDLSNAIVHSGSEFGLTTDVYEVDGKYYIKNGYEVAKDENGNWGVIVPGLGVADSITKEEIDESSKQLENYYESGQALKDLEAYYAKHPDQKH